MNLKQLYGQTEAFLYLTAQPDGQIYADTVGPALPNVDLRIAENGEVQFKSPGMFVSYFKDDAKTRETMTPDGYVIWTALLRPFLNDASAKAGSR